MKQLFKHSINSFLLLTLSVQFAFGQSTVDPKSATPQQIIDLLNSQEARSFDVTPKYDNPFAAMDSAFSPGNAGAGNIKVTYTDANGRVIEADEKSKIKTIELTDSKSGINLSYEPNFEKAFRDWNPAVVSAKYQSEGLDVELNELLTMTKEQAATALAELQKQYRTQRTKISLWDVLNIVESSKLSLHQFPAEALSFYMAVGTNHVINLITEYHKNPMALEMFLEELKSPIGQLSFLAFMIGNRHASHLLSLVFHDIHNPFHRGMRAFAVPYIGMAVGSIFSSLTHDLFMIVKPCATALYGRDKEGKLYLDDPEKTKACTAAMGDFFSRDTAARYTSAVLTVTAATATSSLATMTAHAAKNTTIKGVKKIGRSLRFKGYVIAKRDMKRAIRSMPRLKVATKGLSKAASVVGRFAVGGPIMLGVKIGSIVIFLQSDEFFHPKMHHLVETSLNSGPILRGNKSSLKTTEDYLKTGKYDYEACAKMVNNNFAVARVGIYHTPEEVEQKCDPLIIGIKAAAEANSAHKKWRKNLMYSFDAPYNIWVRFFTEYLQMTNAAKDITYRFLTYLATAEADAKNPESGYNALVHNNPLNGVEFSETLQPTEADYQNSNYFDKENVSRAKRVVEALPLIEQTLQEIAKLKPAAHMTKTELETYEKQLVEAKKLIVTYKTSIEGEAQKTPETKKQEEGFLGSISGAWNQAKSYFNQQVDIAKRYADEFAGKNKRLAEIKTAADRTAQYESLGSALRIINALYITSTAEAATVDFGTYYQLRGSKNVVVDSQAIALRKNSIIKIRKFLGQPQPTKAGGEGLVVDLNDHLQAYYQEVHHLFLQNNMNAAETFVKQFTCAIPFGDEHYQAMERREGIFDYIDQGEAFINKLLRGLGLPISEYTGTPIADWIGKVANYGTGANFVIPGFLSGVDKNELKKICDNPFIPTLPKNIITESDIAPQIADAIGTAKTPSAPTQFWDARASLKMAGKSEKEIDAALARMNQSANSRFTKTEAFKDSNGKAFDSIFSYLIDKMDPAFYARFATENSSDAFTNWFDANMQPKIDLVWQDFHKQYEVLIKDEYQKALFGTKYNWSRYFRNRLGTTSTFDFTFRQQANSPKLIDMANYNKSTSDNVVEDYMHELERYLSILDLLYSQMIDKQAAIKASLTQKFTAMKQPVAPLQNSFLIPNGSDNKYALVSQFLGFVEDELDINSIKTITYTHDIKGINNTAEKNKLHFKYYLYDLKGKVVEMLEVLKNNKPDGGEEMRTADGEVPHIYMHKYRAYNEVFGETLAYFQKVVAAMGVGPGDALTLNYLKENKKYKSLTYADKSLGIATERMNLRATQDKIHPYYKKAALAINGTRFYLGLIGLDGLTEEDKSSLAEAAQASYIQRNSERAKELQEISNRLKTVSTEGNATLTAEEKADKERFDAVLKALEEDQIDIMKGLYPLPAVYKNNKDRYGIADRLSYGAIFRRQVNVAKDCRKLEAARDREHIKNISKIEMVTALAACTEQTTGIKIESIEQLDSANKEAVKACAEQMPPLAYYEKYLGFQADMMLMQCREDSVLESIEYPKELMLASATTNQVYSMLEDLYSQVLFLKASDPEGFYSDHIENTAQPAKPGRGSRPNM